MKEKYREKVKCIYIDPPYNTGNTHFIYKDNYQKSSWLTMKSNRLELIRHFMREDGVLFISIDDNERDNLKKLADMVLDSIKYINTFVWINNLKGRQISGKGAVNTHEYILCFGGKKVKTFTGHIDKFKSIMPSTYKCFEHKIHSDSIGTYVLKNELYNTNSHFNEQTRPNLVFNIHYNFSTGEIRFSGIDENVDYPDFVKIPPKRNSDGIHRFHAWRWSKEKIIKEKANLEFVKTKDGVKIYTKIRDFKITALKDVISDISTNIGSKEIANLLGKAGFINYPKPTKLIEIILSQTKNEDLIVDFFAGSGTTGHAIINLNREDEARRKFILIEMADYFDMILLQRIKKVSFTPEWEDGKPKRIATPKESKNTPKIIKVIRLESYEDTINNVELSKENNIIEKDYTLFYFLDQNQNNVKINLDKIKDPFSCKIKLQINGTNKELKNI
ncbi:MAG: site-specific DNA-methyltransferase [Candidatus Aenigmatarchaeota archaeon]